MKVTVELTDDERELLKELNEECSTAKFCDRYRAECEYALTARNGKCLSTTCPVKVLFNGHCEYGDDISHIPITRYLLDITK